MPPGNFFFPPLYFSPDIHSARVSLILIPTETLGPLLHIILHSLAEDGIPTRETRTNSYFVSTFLIILLKFWGELSAQSYLFLPLI